jgi:hypothetical protein
MSDAVGMYPMLNDGVKRADEARDQICREAGVGEVGRCGYDPCV